MQQGVYTRLIAPDPGKGRAAWQFQDEKRVIVCVYQDHAFPNAQPWRLKLSRLEEDAVYQDQAHHIRCSGGALMEMGIPMPAPWQDFESWVYCFEKV